jgi:hypothetical protein
MRPGSFYVTTYCNFAHRLCDGEPIEHECHVIPPEALQAEMDGDYDRAIEIMSGKPMKRRLRGVKGEEEEESA